MTKLLTIFCASGKLKINIGFLNVTAIIFYLFSFNVLGQEEIRIISYNILNYPVYPSNNSIMVADTTGRNPYFRTIFSAIDADVIVIEEIEREIDAIAFLSNVINASGDNYALGIEFTPGEGEYKITLIE